MRCGRIGTTAANRSSDEQHRLFHVESTTERGNFSTLLSPIVDALDLDPTRHLIKENEFSTWTGSSYLLIIELLVIAESGIVPSSIPTGLLHSETEAEQKNL